MSPGRRQIWTPDDDKLHGEETSLDHLLLYVTVKRMMEEVRKLSEGGIALEFRQSFCSQAFPLLASPHNDIQRAVMTVEKQQVSPPHLWQQLMAHLVFRFLGFHCCK